MPAGNPILPDISPDPILTGFASVYDKSPEFVQNEIAPAVPVKQSFKYPVYKSREAHDDDIVTAISNLDSANEAFRYKPTFTAGTTLRYALKTKISRETTLAPVGFNPLASQQEAVNVLTGKLKTGVEKRLVTGLNAVGNTSGPVAKWDGTSADPEKDIDVGRENFLLRTGMEPTVIIIPPLVAKAAKRASAIRELRKYTDPNLLINGDLPPTLWGLKVVVPGALHNTAAPGLAQSISRIWMNGSNYDVYLLYVNPAISSTGNAMTAIAQFRWLEWGTPYAAYFWPDPDRSVKADWVAVEHHQLEVTVCSDAVERIPDVLT